MRNNNGFTLIELLAVIVVLAVVVVLATRSVLPYMSSAREDAFRIEATNVVESAENALNLYNMGDLTIKNNTASCMKDNYICITVAELIDLALYDGSSETFSGKVIIDYKDELNPIYTLYLQKNSEFSVNGGTEKDYVNGGDVKNGGLTDNKSKECTCS